MLWSYVVLVIAGFLTAIFSAVFGVAGGMMLFVILSLFLDAATAVPLHASVQLVSNVSRVAVSFSHINKGILWRYSLLIIPGAFAGSLFYKYFNPDLLEMIVGATILLVIYLPMKEVGKWTDNRNVFILLGFVSGFLGMIIGVVGPLISPFFMKNGISKEKMVATKAACQALVQLVKIPTFGLVIQFDFGKYQYLIIAMCVITVAGTWIGKSLIHKISDDQYHSWEKYILTVLSLILIVKAGYHYW